MPELVICKKCGAVLYEGEELKSPEQVILDHDGKCPNCGKKLSYIPKSFEVKPVDETNQLRQLEPEKKRPQRKKSWNRTRKRERRIARRWINST